MDGEVSVDVPWHVAKFLCDKAKGSKRKSLMYNAHLIGKIASYYELITLGALRDTTLGHEYILYDRCPDGRYGHKQGTKHGVNFMSGNPGYSTASSPSAARLIRTFDAISVGVVGGKRIRKHIN
ncbi:hypothetical protein Tco_0430933 [Tanacetum coccineum]